MPLAVQKHVHDAFVSIETLREALREDVGFVVLEVISSTTYVKSFAPAQFCREEAEPYRPSAEEAALHIMAGWAWLQREGLLIRNPQTMIGGDDYVISPDGRKLLDPQRFEAYKQAALLPRALLHPVILDASMPDYSRGKYDLAIFAAMRQLEIEIRSAAKLPNSLVGAKLARAAFSPKTGSLRDKNATEQEQAAICDTFVSAIGTLRNPTSHRVVEFSDPSEVAQILIYASYLMRLVDRSKA